MKTRAVILAGGEGSRLGTLTAKRTKPAVIFAGKYRIIDFTLSNCVNSGVYDVMILAQYRPHSLIEHIGSGGPWDLAREFTGGVRIYSPYKARGASDWYLGTADAVQQNFLFIKSNKPDLVLILSGDHIYKMNYRGMIDFHMQQNADLTMATIRVPLEEASRFGIVGVGEDMSVTHFVEKPKDPPSDLANMGVYLFNREVLDKALWEDHTRTDSSHDFGKDILPRLVAQGRRVYAYPYEDYWVDVGTIDSYWQAHMDLLGEPPTMDLNDRSWIIHTRTEERPPVRIAHGASIKDSLICDGCVIGDGAIIDKSVLSPGVVIAPGAIVRQSVIQTDSEIDTGAIVERAILDKRVRLERDVRIGRLGYTGPNPIPMVGKNSILPEGLVVEPGAVIATDVIASDFTQKLVRSSEFIQTRRLPNEL
jgi:glucose-1-phosphate adenylyltransferase